MRGKWINAPAHHQDCPADNTDEYCWDQTRVWAQSGGTDHVHPEIAMQIASYWHSPSQRDEAITVFASTGTITDGLAEDIDRERKPYRDTWNASFGKSIITPSSLRGVLVDALRNWTMLDALLAYVRACPVTAYTVGKNIAGYLPESDPAYRGLDYREAVQAYMDMLTDEAPEDVARDDECACCDDYTCELCTVEALVKSYLRDDGPVDFPGHSRYGQPAGLVIPADSWAGSMSYWLHVDTMPYGTLVDDTAE